MMRVCVLLMLMMLAAAPAQTQSHYYNPAETEKAPESEEPRKFLSVTSIQKCYDQVGREEALDIQKNYVKPYQECQRRLQQQLKEKPAQQKTPAAEDQPGEPALHVLRVQKPKEKPKATPPEKKENK